MTLDLVAQHMGALHPVETALTLLLAFGPFVALFIVIVVRRRHDRDAESETGAGSETVVEESAERVPQR